jgi:hypothetical protein
MSPLFAHPFEFIPFEEIPHNLVGAVESFIGSCKTGGGDWAAKGKRENEAHKPMRTSAS